jgi:hypothetical protein
MKKIILILLALILLPCWAWGANDLKDEPVQVASLLLLGVGKATYAAPAGTTWFVLMPSSTDYVLMPSSTDKVKKPGH